MNEKYLLETAVIKAEDAEDCEQTTLAKNQTCRRPFCCPSLFVQLTQYR